VLRRFYRLARVAVTPPLRDRSAGNLTVRMLRFRLEQLLQLA